MDIKLIEDYAKKQFDQTLMPALMDYIKIPNQSPAFDPQWETNGLIEKACNLIVDYIKKLVNASYRISRELILKYSRMHHSRRLYI
jgi:hypothetical protein